jgi:uncharacterized protein YjiK
MKIKIPAALALSLSAAAAAFAQPASIDLSTYVRVGRYALPEPVNSHPGAPNLLAQEASGVTYNKDTDTLFIVGDGGRAVVQVSKTGQLIDSMTLATGGSPQGTSFYDPEGITYVGGGKFVLVEERYRQASLFTYTPNTTLAINSPGVQTVKLGTTIGNIGLEGLSYDPKTGGYIFVKESGPQGIFQTTIDFAAGTASNGSPITVNSTNLFNPALANLLDFADVFALSNLPSLLPAQADSLLVLSQESGIIRQMTRDGTILSSLTLTAGTGVSLADTQHEGLTMDLNGILYVVSENGGGDINHPELWVYAPIPEPSTYAALAGLVTLGVAAMRRRRVIA